MRKPIVFLSANSSWSHASLAAWRLRHAADPAQWDWVSVETTITEPVEAVLERVLAAKPAVLAATFYLFNREWLASFLARFKALSPGTRVIGGGPEWLGACESFFHPVPLADAGIRGEGEIAFREWLAVWDQPNRWGEIRGLVYVDAAGIHDTGAEAAAPGPDAIPRLEPGDVAGFRKPFIQLETSRGCRGACLFCTSGRGGGVREFPLERVTAELAVIREAGIREVRVLDRTFNGDEARALAVLELFRAECPDTRFHLEVDPVLVTESFADALRRFRPGFLHVEAGVQSLDDETRRLSGRRGTGAEAIAGLKRLASVPGLEVHADLIAGLPGGTGESLKQDLILLTLLGVDEIQLEVLKVLPGTRLESAGARWGIVASPLPPYEVLRTRTFPAEALWRAARVSRAVDGFHNARSLRAVTRKACMMIPDFWNSLAEAAAAGGRGAGPLSLRNRFRIGKRFLAERMPELVPELVDAWYRGDHGIDEELAPAQMWRGPLPDGLRPVMDGQGPFDRVIAVDGPPARYYAFRVEPDGHRRLAAVFERNQAENRTSKCPSDSLTP